MGILNIMADEASKCSSDDMLNVNESYVYAGCTEQAYAFRSSITGLLQHVKKEVKCVVYCDKGTKSYILIPNVITPPVGATLNVITSRRGCVELSLSGNIEFNREGKLEVDTGVIKRALGMFSDFNITDLLINLTVELMGYSLQKGIRYNDAVDVICKFLNKSYAISETADWSEEELVLRNTFVGMLIGHELSEFADTLFRKYNEVYWEPGLCGDGKTMIRPKFEGVLLKNLYEGDAVSNLD